ncbi:hypothetical protein [Micromonospora thermarum]|uniref:Uncharacterized protein n=1 Tax=Micromonospora thermarum TaxID=2720024 RepID=A0ABX0Z8Z9_9ACTN|nr:hypothetical protein [Micromonospora thermarum]NJP33712.1 hypothetical protein [Micromonospora thermarum]
MTAPATPDRHLHLPAPAPYEGPERCRACAGARITGMQVTWLPEQQAPRVLVVDVLCPVCDGCGRATHDGCRPDEHADQDAWRDSMDDGEDDHDEPRCYSCHGLRWHPVLAWANGGADMFTLRMPCGCATDLLEEVPAP